MPSKATVHTVRRKCVFGGRVQYNAVVQYPGEARMTMRFVGPAHGCAGPVVMITPDDVQTFVADPARFGDFGPKWVRKFYE